MALVFFLLGFYAIFSMAAMIMCQDYLHSEVDEDLLVFWTVMYGVFWPITFIYVFLRSICKFVSHFFRGLRKAIGRLKG